MIPLSAKNKICEIEATMRMEGMPLSSEDIRMLEKIEAGKLTTDDVRRQIIEEAQMDT